MHLHVPPTPSKPHAGFHFIFVGCTSGLVVKELACDQKVAGSSPTSCRLFFAHEYTQLYPQIEEAVSHCHPSERM